MSNGTNVNSSGESDVQFDFTRMIEGVDQISDDVMAEFVRRMQGFTGTGVSGAVVQSDTPPQDKSKLWDKGDGTLYRYDTASGQWVPAQTLPEVDEFPGISSEEGNIITEKGDGIYADRLTGRLIDRTLSLRGRDPSGPAVIGFDIAPAFDNADYIAIVTPEGDFLTGTYWWESKRDADRYEITVVTDGSYDDTVDGTDIRIVLIQNNTTDE